MRKFLRRFFCALLSLVLVAAVSTAIAVPAVIRSRGDLSDYMVSEEFQESIGKANAKRAKDTSARIMSANLLVHYESWGGTDAHKRAKMFLQVLDTYRPDVVAVQEMSDQWYCCLMQNRGSYKLLYPVRTGALVRMTGLLYDSDRVTLLEQGDVAYDRGDDVRLRRIVWGLFQNNQSGEKYIVSSTHLDLIRSGEEKAERAVMESQADQAAALAKSLAAQYKCPVFACGDFNAMDAGGYDPVYDAPEIYSRLAKKMQDTKALAAKTKSGNNKKASAPTYDHIFLTGTAKVRCYGILSDGAMDAMSDHYPIYADVKI